MKYSDFILKHFVVYALIGGLLPFLIVKNEVFNVDDRIVAFPLIMICYAHFYYQKRLSKIARVGDLKEYSKLKNYDFIEKPSESDLDDFATFETLPLIMDKGDKDAFMNLLTHSQRQELYSAEKPKIITVKKTHTTAMVNRGDREILFTQVFLLKSKKENTITTIPKNTVQIIVTVRSQRKCNYFISFIPMKSAAESEKIIPPSSV